jgi:8-oxo-dGTP diphosphatase
MANRSTHVFRLGVFAIIEEKGKILLARRSDIGWWNLPGGGMEAGEAVDEALRREIREEVGLEIAIDYLVGVYSKPQKNEVVLTFHCHPTGGTATTSDEVSEIGWFVATDLPDQLLPKHRQRLIDALQPADHAVIRSQTTSTEDDQGLSKPM